MWHFNHGGACTINSQSSSIGNNEWRIALRKGEGYVVSGGSTYFLWDYHFWLQCNSGDWCHKQGRTPSSYLAIANNFNENFSAVPIEKHKSKNILVNINPYHRSIDSSAQPKAYKEGVTKFVSNW